MVLIQITSCLWQRDTNMARCTIREQTGRYVNLDAGDDDDQLLL